MFEVELGTGGCLIGCVVLWQYKQQYPRHSIYLREGDNAVFSDDEVSEGEEESEGENILDGFIVDEAKEDENTPGEEDKR